MFSSVGFAHLWSLVLHSVLHGSMRAYLGHIYFVVLFGTHKERTNSAIYEWLSN